MPRKHVPLYLHEEIMLLSLRDEAGTVEFGVWYQHAIAGAILAELLMGERITVDEGKKQFVNIVDSRQFDEPVIDECLSRIATANRRAMLPTWLQRIARTKQLKHRVAAGLCRRGVLREDEDRVLLIFRRRIYPELDPAPERALIERLRKAILDDDTVVDPRTAILVSLARSADLLKVAIPKKELKTRKKRLDQLVNGALMGHATKKAIEAAQAALLLGACVPAFVTTTSLH